MSLSPFSSKRTRKSNTRRSAARRSRRPQGMEPLEPRRLLAVTAVADFETVLDSGSAVVLEVLANDIDTSDLRGQSVSAGNLTVDGSSAWSFAETGAAPNNLTTTTVNTGDVNIQLDGADIDPSSGVTLATVRQNLASEYRVIEAYPSGAATWLSMQKQSANTEADVDAGVVNFPFAAGWIGGNVDPSGVLLSGNGLSASDVSQTGGGRYQVQIPGVSDSFTDGYLFVIGASNEDNFASARPLGGNAWEISVRDNTADLLDGENDDFSFVYIPRNAPGLVAGRVDAAYSISNPVSDAVGEFTVAKEGPGTWRLNVAGGSPALGMLLLGSAVDNGVAPEDDFFSYEPAGDGFVIKARDQDGGQLVDADFQFAYVPFTNALQPTLTLSISAADAATAESGLPITINPDNTISIDTSSLSLTAPQTETFSYTVTDGTETSTATASVTLLPTSGATTTSQVFGENETATIDLSKIFTAGTGPYTYAASDSRIVAATFSGDTLTLASNNNAFGFDTVTITATDSTSATFVTAFEVNILPDVTDTDAPIAGDDSASTLSFETVDIDVLGNDYHPNGVAYDVAAANIDVDISSTWTVTNTGAAPNDMVITSPANRGDNEVGLGGTKLYPSTGVLLGTVRDNTDPYGTVNTHPHWGSYGFSTERGAGGNAEADFPLAAAFFPFADGWTSGQVDAAGTLTHGVGVAQSNITKLRDGMFAITLPEVTDAATDGFLFAICHNNDDNAYSVLPVAGTNTWIYRQTDNDADTFENDKFAFVYVPADTPELVAGRFDATGSQLQKVETGAGYSLTQEAAGTYRLSITGFTPTDGSLLVLGSGADASSGNPDNIITSYIADGNDFLIFTRQTVDFALVDAEFQFVFTPFANPLSFNRNVAFSVTAFEAASAEGATISQNPDGTFRYDPSTSTSIQALTPGSSLSDTFTYTITDAAGEAATGTVTVTVRAPEVDAIDDTFWISQSTILNVTANDTFGPRPGQHVSALNIGVDLANSNQGSNQQDSFIPLDANGNQQRSTIPGSVVIDEAHDNWGDIDLYIDVDGGELAADKSDLLRMNRNDGIVIATINDNRDAILGQGGYATLEVVSEGGGNMWIATAQAPFPDIDVAGTDEEAVAVSAAYFAFDKGWIGGHVNGAGTIVASNGDPVVTRTATGIYEIEIPGVTDSYTQGFLYSVGASNEANVTQSRPLGGNKWELILHDNSFSKIAQPDGEGNDFAFVYIPQNATGLVGGRVNGASTSVNPTKQSIGNFSIQRSAQGEWVLSVPGHSPETGMLLLEGQTLTSPQPEHIFLSYEAASNGTDFVIQQHSLPDPNIRTDHDFQFLFVPFNNRITQAAEQLPMSVDQVGTAADPTSGLSELGFALTINPDGTVGYDAGGTIRSLGEGQTATDTFVYRVTDSTGASSDSATVTVTHVGVNDAPDVVGSLADQSLAEDASTVSVSLDGLFADVDTGDVLTLSATTADGTLLSVAVNGTSLEITPVANAFGFTSVMVIATDIAGATNSTSLNVTVLPTLGDDTPTAGDDTATTLNTEIVTISVLSNDVHPDGAVNDAAAATIDVPPGADNVGSTWTVVGTGSGVNALTIQSQPNAGDVAIGLAGNGIQPTDGVLLGTSRDNLDPFSSVQEWYWGTYNSLGFGTQSANQNGSGERSGSVGAVFFPFADGWTAGRVDGTGELLQGVGLTPADITKVASGEYSITVPGVSDAATAGYLMSIGGTNNFDITSSAQAQAGTGNWTLRQRYNDDAGLFDNQFSFVYIANDTPNLIAGRVAADGTLDASLQSGSPTVVKDATGLYRLTLPGLTPDDGTLLLTESGGNPIALNYTASGSDFLIEARDIPTFIATDAQFDFVFAPFAAPLTPFAPASLSITAFDATSTLGGAVTLNADGTFAYDPAGVTVTPGTSVSDTFTYTISDGNSNTSTATVTVTVSAPGPNVADDSFTLAVGQSGLNVLANDTFGQPPLQQPGQTVSSVNFEFLPGSAVQSSNDADWIIPLDTNGDEQRSHIPGAITFDGVQQNWGDIDLWVDVNGDGSSLRRMNPADGVVIPTIAENRSAIIAESGGYASAEVHQEGNAAGNMWIATASVTGGDEEAVYVSAAYFPFAEGWVGGHYDEGLPGLAVVNGDGVNADPSVSDIGGGRWRVTIPGVTDSTTDGVLFVIGGSNEDNVASSRPLGGSDWEVAVRDNASAAGGGEVDDFSFVYVPRNATGLIGGHVIGDATVANPMRQSVGDFTIQRTAAGEWNLSIPGHSPETGVLIFQSNDPSATDASHVLFSYDAADNGTDFVIHQHLLPTPDTRPDLDFNFLFIPFANQISQTGPLTVDQFGSTADPASGLSELGNPLTLNADGTIGYDAGNVLAPLGEGDTLSDSFVYRATTGSLTGTATATITLLGVNDAPVAVESIDDRILDEDAAPVTISLATLFTDVDNGDVVTLSAVSSQEGVVSAAVAADSTDLVITPQADAFGVSRITVTGTDQSGATATVTFFVTVMPTVDGPTAVADAEAVAADATLTIPVLGNDFHADNGVYEVAAANITVDSTATSNAGSTWTVEQTGAQPNEMNVLSAGNVGDVQIGINGQTFTPADGVLYGTMRENIDPFGTVNTYGAFGTYGFATDTGVGGGERNAPLGAAFFPFADGWIGGHVAADGTLMSGRGVAPANVVKLSTGFYEVSIPGVTDSFQDGFLFAITQSNDDNAFAARPIGGNTWQFRQLDNDSDASGFEDDAWSFVYIPANLPGLVAGRYTGFSEGGQLDQSVGNFTLGETFINPGEFSLTIPGASPTDGILMLVSTGGEFVAEVNAEAPDNRVLNYTASGSDFLIQGRQTGDFAPAATSFAFAYVPFSSPYKLNAYADYSIVAFDATSTEGATITDNGDGTFGYDPATSISLADLVVGTTLDDTFTYTIQDGNGVQSVGTVTVTVSGVAPAATLTLTAASGTVAEDAATAAMTVTRDGDLTAEMVVNLSSGNTDVGTVESSVTIPAGEASASFNVTLVNNDLYSGTRGVAITASSDSAAAASATLAVTDDETGSLVISEIMYDSSGAEPQGEWVEVFNAGSTTIDLGGWYLDDEDANVFTPVPAGTLLPPEGVAVIFNADGGNQTADAFRADWSTAADPTVIVIGVGWGSLANSPSETNEVLVVRNGNGDVEDEANYQENGAGGWPTSGQGISFYLTDTAADNNVGSNWAASVAGVDGAVNAAGTIWSASDVASPGFVPGLGGTEVSVGDGQTVTDTTVYTGDTTIVKTGNGTLILNLANTHTGGLQVDAGTVVIQNAAALNGGPLTVAAGAKVMLEVGSTLMPLSSLSLDPAARLDVGAGGVTVASGGFTAADIRTALIAGRNGGTWDGTAGITFTVQGAAAAATSFSVGYVVDGNGLLTVRYTGTGDSQLDGKVDFDDILGLFPNYGATGSFVWSEGDFTYDGKVDFDDILALFPNYGSDAVFSAGLLGQGGGSGAGNGGDTGAGGMAVAQSTGTAGGDTTEQPVMGPEAPADLPTRSVAALPRDSRGVTSGPDATTLAFAALASEGSSVTTSTDSKKSVFATL